MLLVGAETKNRKHVDWELYSSMRDSPRNGKSGVLL
ncbi:TIR domain-containing protein [Klebsiella pneumoniae]